MIISEIIVKILRDKNMSQNEFANLMSKKSTSSWCGRRKLPKAITEQGIYMLMTVLRDDLATRQSKALVRTLIK